MQNAKRICLVIVGLLMCTSRFTFATPTTNLLVTDMSNHRVIEVDPITHNVVWQYGLTGNPGSGPNQLNNPWEAVRLTDGNTLIADYSNQRVLEVRPTDTSGGTILWEYTEPGGNFYPKDVKKLPNGNVLITDTGNDRVLEVTPVYPNTAIIVWKSSSMPQEGIPLKEPWEAEKRGTDTYLITDYGNHRVIEVQATGPSGGNIIWQYGLTGSYGFRPNELNYPTDANRLICNTILISDWRNQRVIEVQPTGTFGGTIVWECSPATGLTLNGPREAIRMSNWNTLIVDSNAHRVIEVKTGDYPNFATASIVWQQGQTGVAGSGTNQLYSPVDVEELGIVNIAKAKYQDFTYKDMPRKFAGIVVPFLPPVANLPEIKLNKSVSPTEPVSIGAILTYTIYYSNVGSGTATNVEITDMIPDGTEYVIGTSKVVSGPAATKFYSHNGGLNFDNSQSTPVTHVKWSIFSVAPYESGALEFKVVVK